MKILFLDDSHLRMAAARWKFRREKFFEATTAVEAIRLIHEESPVHLVHLDHDLGCLRSERLSAETGYDVARYLARMPRGYLPNQVVIHSWNAEGARRMKEVLEPVVPVRIEPFAAPEDYRGRSRRR